MKKFLKRSLIGLTSILLLMIVAAVAIPYFFKDEIKEFALKKINEQIDAKVEVKDVNLSLLWSFPDFTFSLEGVTVDGKGKFNGVRLAEMESFDFRLDLMSVFNRATQPIEIKEIALRKPMLNVLVLRDGSANYNIYNSTDSSKTEESDSKFDIKLEKYGVYNASVTYDDRQGGSYARLLDFTHSGVGKFTESIYDIDTKTDCQSMSVGYGGVTYLKDAILDSKITVGANMKESRFSLQDNYVKINDLQFDFKGWVKQDTASTIMDLKFSSPQTEFSSFLSLIPAAYTKDYKDVKTKGSFKFDGFAKGTYAESTMPSFGINLQVDNAYFKYPSLPMAVEDIKVKASILSPSSNLDQLVVDVPALHLRLGANPFDANFHVSTPMSDPNVRAAVDGKLNLADLSKAFPMESVKELSGLITANFKTDTRMSYVTNEQYEKVNMSGKVDIQQMKYHGVGYPVVLINNLNTEFTPNNVKVNNFDAKLGKSDIKASGTLDNILTYFSRDKIMKGVVTMNSNLFDCNEWLGEEKTDSKAPATTTSTGTTPTSGSDDYFDKFDFTGDISFGKLLYGEYVMNNLKAKGNFTPSQAKLENFETQIGASDFKANGLVKNWWGYVFRNEKIEGVLNFNSNNMDFNQFMSKADEKTNANQPVDEPKSDYAAPAVPANLDFVMNAAIGTLKYTTYLLTDCIGQLTIRDRKIVFDNFSANTLGGNFKINGAYDTQKEDKPKFDFGLNLNQFKFKETAKAMASVKKMFPIFEQMDGIFNTTFKISANLKPNMMPDLATVNADGLLETINTSIQNLRPAQALSAKTGIKELGQNLNIGNTTNFFTIENGNLVIKPSDIKLGPDLKLNAGGKQKLDGNMDYNFVFEVPKSKLTANTAGAAANELLGSLNAQTSKLGLNVAPGDIVNFNVNMTGTYLAPKFGIKFLGTGKGGSIKEQAQAAVQQQVDNAKAEIETRARAEADKLKADAEAKAKAELEKGKLEAERLKKEAEDKAKAEAARLKKEAEDKIKAEADKLRNKIPNPFGRN